jgi:hypothetical protein
MQRPKHVGSEAIEDAIGEELRATP